NFATAYPALQQRCGPATRINLNSLEGIDEQELLVRIARKVAQLYELTYDVPLLDKPSLEQNLKTIADAALRETMGTGTRRLLVKSCVEHFDAIRDEAQELSVCDASRMIVAAVDDLRSEELAVVEA